MESWDWKIIKTIAEEKNITKSAEKLYISQPALTYRIKNIEKELGVQLFLRETRGVSLTKQGVFLYKYALEMLDSLKKLQLKIKNPELTLHDTILVGTSSMYASDEFYHVLKEFRDQNSNIDIRLQTGINDEIISLLQESELDVGIIVGKTVMATENIFLGNAKACIIYNKPFEIHDLLNIPRVLYMPKSPNIQDVLDKWWYETFTSPYILGLGTNNVDILYQAVDNGLGWASISNMEKKFRRKGLYYKEILWKDGTPLYWETYAITNEKTLKKFSCKMFLSHLLSYYKI